jgi:hypothetical protein
MEAVSRIFWWLTVNDVTSNGGQTKPDVILGPFANDPREELKKLADAVQ